MNNDSRFSRNDNLAPFFDSSKLKQKNVERSAFDYGRSHSFQTRFGLLCVADCFPTLPNSNYKLACQLNATFRNPTVRKLINNCRIYVEYFYCRESDLWEGSHNLVTKGRSGNIQKEYPSLIFNTLPSGDSSDLTGNYVGFDTPDSLLDDFGIPCSVVRDFSQEGYNPIDSFKSISHSDFDVSGVPNRIGDYRNIALQNNRDLYINALPFFMYQKIWRDFYVNKNLAYGNKNLLPDNEEHFVIPYNQDSIFYLDYSTVSGATQKQFVLDNDVMFHDYNMTFENTPLFLAQKRFRQYRGDYFTTAFPFPEGVRGNIPTLELSSNTDDLAITIPSQNITIPGGAVGALSGNTSAKLAWNGSDIVLTTTSGVSSGSQIGMTSQRVTVPSQEVTGSLSVSTSITMNDIRSLEALTEFQMKMAQTDGDYHDMIKAQFGKSRVKTSRQPVYIGGFYQDILVNSVFQTSQSSEDSPLGRQSGIGVSSGEHYIDDFFADDYGYIMAVLSVVPEVYYTTGLDRMHSTRLQSDVYFPVFNNLAPQPVLNKEIFVSGDSSVDNDVFAYVERYSNFKSRRNLLTGQGRFYVHTDNIGLQPVSIYDNARAIVRNFINTPNFNNDFVQATDVDMSSFSVTTENPLDIDFGSKVTAVLPMPYITVPGGNDND